MKVYVLICEYGEYEDRTTFIERIFIERAKAEAFAESQHPGFIAWQMAQKASDLRHAELCHKYGNPPWTNDIYQLVLKSPIYPYPPTADHCHFWIEEHEVQE